MSSTPSPPRTSRIGRGRPATRRPARRQRSALGRRLAAGARHGCPGPGGPARTQRLRRPERLAAGSGAGRQCRRHEHHLGHAQSSPLGPRRQHQHQPHGRAVGPAALRQRARRQRQSDLGPVRQLRGHHPGSQRHHGRRRPHRRPGRHRQPRRGRRRPERHRDRQRRDNRNRQHRRHWPSAQAPASLRRAGLPSAPDHSLRAPTRRPSCSAARACAPRSAPSRSARPATSARSPTWRAARPIPTRSICASCAASAPASRPRSAQAQASTG